MANNQKNKAYNGNINEFVDWSTGYSELKGKSILANDEYVSGKSIRQLIQERLRNPICMISDTEAGLYRVFSSRDAYVAWSQDRETYSGLELFNFVRPSDYEITIDGLNATNRYMIHGVQNDDITTLKFNWNVVNGQGKQGNDTIIITYKITNENGAVHTFANKYDMNERHVEINLGEYLGLGQNEISMDIRGKSTGASNYVSIFITELILNLESDFNYAGGNGGYQQGTPIIFSAKLTRNNANNACALYVKVDDIELPKQDLQNGSQDVVAQVTIPTTNLVGSTRANENTGDDGRRIHTLQMCVQTTYNGLTFTSNILYYTFEINTKETGLKNYFINTALNFPAGSKIFPIYENSLYLEATQYLPIDINWAYFTDNIGFETTIQVNWKLYENDIVYDIASLEVSKGEYPDKLTLVPITYSKEINYIPESSSIHLVAEYTPEGTNKIVRMLSIPMYIKKSALNIVETDGYDFKLSAFGKSNSSSTKSIWEAEFAPLYTEEQKNAITFDFHNIKWDDNSGWYNNAFRTSGENSYCEIAYDAFGSNNVSTNNGLTIEIEFESEKVSETTDVLMSIGIPNIVRNTSRIEITPNKATLYDQDGAVCIYTNYKANERVKLAFVINPENLSRDSKLIYIVTDGILERAAKVEQHQFNTNGNGKIIIGNSNSGIKLYSLRVYKYALSYNNLYNNFIYDNDNKVQLINKNNVLNNSTLKIDYAACCKRLDTILITGNLTSTNFFNDGNKDHVLDVNIERYCPYDQTRNFTVEGCQIRKHGQSTLNYPITSLKFWLNKSTTGAVPKMTWEGAPEATLSKNRYIMKEGCVPSNKFILQANYADSSGVHNGTFLRMINNSWFNAQFGENKEHKLRTEPQLFSTNETSTLEDGTVMGKNENNQNWDDVTKVGTRSFPFPYNIKISPDSFPCVVFYKDTGSNTETFLGQYVFMEDKKSDFCYGERSIYNSDPFDPFCLTVANKDEDIDENKVWDNKNVLRIEVINIDNKFTSYMSEIDDRGIAFDQPIQAQGIYRWEQDFELIYPDPDDVQGHAIGEPKKNGGFYTKDTTKFGEDSEFRKQTQSFVDWFKWLVSTYNNQQKFQNEAAQHIDLYKMAAYYIIMLRCGLVDSGERNVQIKTYDGVHFHYEPWDMDIALGNQNTGGIVFEPPIDRNTRLGDTYAISGRSVDANTGETITSNWLWDALEAWPHFANEIVPEVAEALYKAGFNYKTLVDIFDNQFTNKWCETIYNESGYFKYIISGGEDHGFLPWLQGARINHRHWWLSTSMDYYDAKWTCGEFKSHFVYIAAGHLPKASGTDIIRVYPSCPTFLTLTQNDGDIISDDIANNIDNGDESIDDSTVKISDAQECSRNQPAEFDISTISFSNKVPTKILGATYIEKLDVSCLSDRINLLNIAGAYSDVNGAPIKELYVGNHLFKNESDIDDYHWSSRANRTYNLSIQLNQNYDNLENLQTIDITGQIGKPGEAPTLTAQTLMVGPNTSVGRTQIKNVYAMGSNLSYFRSAPSGNTFNEIKLPGVNRDENGNILSQLTQIEFNNTSWNDLSFWDGTWDPNTNSLRYVKCNVNSNYDLNIPTSVRSIKFTGNTANNAKAKQLIFDWLTAIETEIRLNNQNSTEEEIQALINTDLSNRTLILTGLQWDKTTCGNNYELVYDDLIKLSKLNHGENKNGSTYKGYILVTPNNGETLNTIQLTILKGLYGDGIFELTSSGLIIDQEHNDTTINLGGDAYIEENEWGDLEFYLREVPLTNGSTGNKKYNDGRGGTASLSATKFALRISENQYVWYLQDPAGGESSNEFKGCQIIHSNDDGRDYLIAREWYEGDYQVKLCVMVQVEYEDPDTHETITETETRYEIINIIGATYPNSLALTLNKDQGSYRGINETQTAYMFVSSNSLGEFYINWNTDDNFTAYIKDVKYTLVRNLDNTVLINNESYSNYTGGAVVTLNDNEEFLQKQYSQQKRFGMTLRAFDSPNDLTMYEYTLTAKVFFSSPKVPSENGQPLKTSYDLTKNIIVMKDNTPILQSGSVLYNIIKRTYDDYHRNIDGLVLPLTVYRYHLLDLGDEIVLNQLDESTNSYLSSLVTNGSHETILKYLVNIKTLHLPFNVPIYNDSINGDTVASKNQYDFSNMVNLDTVLMMYVGEALKAEVPLTIDGVVSNYSCDVLDFTHNSKLKNVYSEGTSINMIFAQGAQVELIHFGTPTSVILNNMTALTKENISCTDSSNIEDIQIVNCGNNESFGIFGKIMGIE